MFRLSAFYLAVRVLNGLLSLLSLYFLSRMLTSAEYGRYALITAASGFLATVGFQWINVAVARFHSSRPNAEGVVVREAFSLYGLCVVPVLLLCFAAVHLQMLPWVTPFSTGVVALGAVALALHALGLQFANARQAPLMYGSISLIRAALGLFAAVFFINKGLSGEGAALGFAISAALSVGVLLWSLRKLTFSRDDSLRREMIQYGLPLGIAFLATMTLDFSGRFIIGFVLGEASVAPYALGYDLVQQIVGAATNAVFLAAFPSVVRQWEQSGSAAARSALQKVLQVMLILTPLLMMPFLAVPRELSEMMFGSQMPEIASAVMPWIATAIMIGAFKSYYLDVAFQLVKDSRTQLYITVVMAGINVVFTLLLLPRVGVVGAAMATTAAFATGAALSWWWGRRQGLYRLDAWQLSIAVMITIIVVVVGRWAAQTTVGGWAAILVASAAAGVAFVTTALLFDLGGVRGYAMSRLKSGSL
jgi:O-antigen/teichoic acid export membrane protein